MQERSKQAIWVRILQAFALLLLLCFLVNLLFAALQPFERTNLAAFRVYTSRNEYPTNSNSALTNQIREQEKLLERELIFSVQPSAFKIHQRLVVPLDSPISQVVQQGWLEQDLLIFSEKIFGYIQVNGNGLTAKDFTGAHWTLDKNQDRLEVTIDAIKAINPQSTAFIWIGEKTPARFSSFSERPSFKEVDLDKIEIQLNEARLTGTNQVPDVVSAEKVVYTARDSEKIANLSFDLADVKLSTAVSSRLLRRGFLNKLSEGLSVPLLSTILVSIAEVLPVLLYFALLRKYSPTVQKSFIDKFGRILTALLIFHFLLYTFSGLSELYRSLSFLKTLSQNIEQITSLQFGMAFRNVFSNGAYPYHAGVVMVGILVPKILWDWDHACPASQPTKWKSSFVYKFMVSLLWVGAFSPLLAALALLAGQILTNAPLSSSSILSNIPFTVWILSITCLISLLIFTTLRGLCGLVDAKQDSPLFVLLAVWVLVLIALVDNVRWNNIISPQFSSPIWFILTTVFGAALLYALGKLINSGVKQAFPQLTLPGRVSRYSWVLALILVIPLNRLISIESPATHFTDIFALVFQMDNYILLIWIVGAGYLLKHYGQSSPEIDPFARDLGILVAASLLFSSLSLWIYIPVAFLCGLLTLHYFVQNSKVWDHLQRLYQRVVTERTELLEQVININAAEAAYWEYRKQETKNLGEGKLTISEFDAKLSSRRESLDKRQDDAKIDDRSYKDIALAFGPYPTALKNAVHGMTWALIFSIPWLVLYLDEFLRANLGTSSYPLWEILRSPLLAILKWLAVGFLFGYFYPYLRGKDGVQKGLSLFIAIVLPVLPMAAIRSQTVADWNPVLVFILEMFILCMLLGLVAFDYWTLRQCRRGWHMLFEVHSLTSIGLSVSTIAVAIGTVITAFITNPKLLGMTVNLLIPTIPVDFLTNIVK